MPTTLEEAKYSFFCQIYVHIFYILALTCASFSHCFTSFSHKENNYKSYIFLQMLQNERKLLVVVVVVVAVVVVVF